MRAKVKVGIVILDVLVGSVPVAVDGLTGGWKALDSTECSVMLPETQ